MKLYCSIIYFSLFFFCSLIAFLTAKSPSFLLFLLYRNEYCIFRTNPASDSAENLPPIPEQTLPLFLADFQSTKLIFFSLVALLFFSCSFIVFLFFLVILHLILFGVMNGQHDPILHRLLLHHQLFHTSLKQEAVM